MIVTASRTLNQTRTTRIDLIVAISVTLVTLEPGEFRNTWNRDARLCLIEHSPPHCRHISNSSWAQCVENFGIQFALR
ncbi:hypothetical protein IC762_03565 [Bradyrhizobium genosp. L]|uniref:hypothetical protein n=1 Tax=Bradyrhizobium genosp. L TaxID=83637 RepID=UPI0018A310F0|nr:hypothetical protein [Bradyrhizobium genosp. L]QPF88438.1 hypothetical protein IC762_03565 [Bradyrhizobium genosp. L]